MIHTHGCWNHSPAHVAGGPLQPIGTHVSKLTNAFQAPQGEENWESGCVSAFQVQGHRGCIRDPERLYRRCKLGQSNVAAPQMPDHDTHTPPTPPPHAPGSLPLTFTGSHVTCLVTSVWVKMCLMKPNLERNPQCQERAAPPPFLHTSDQPDATGLLHPGFMDCLTGGPEPLLVPEYVQAQKASLGQ